MYHFLLRNIVGILLLGCSGVGMAQSLPYLRVRQLTQENGLAHPQVNAVVQDHKGLIWAATEDGLNLFDSYRFWTFSRINSDSFSLPDNRVRALWSDSDRQIWAATAGGGLARYDARKRRFTNFIFSDATGQPYELLSVVEDPKNGILWIGTDNGILQFEYRKGLLRRSFQAEEFNARSIAPGYAQTLFVDKKGRPWCTNGSFLQVLTNAERAEFQTFSRKPANRKTDVSFGIQGALEDAQGRIWVAASAYGLCRLDQQTGELYSYHPEPSGANGRNVMAMAMRPDGILWLATSQGLEAFDTKTERFLVPDIEEYYLNILNQTEITQLYCDQNGDLWAATKNGLYFIYENFKHFKTLRYQPGISNTLLHPSVNSLHINKKREIWIGSRQGLSVMRTLANKDTFIHFIPTEGSGNRRRNLIQTFWEDKIGSLYVGTGDGPWQFDAETRTFKLFYADSLYARLTNTTVFAMAEDRKGQLWIGTNKGLFRLSRNRETLRHYAHDPTLIRSIPHHTIRHLLVDSRGILWMTSTEGGIARYEEATDDFMCYRHDPNKPQTLSSNAARSIFEGKGGVLWVTTYGAGINRFDPKTGQVKRYGHLQGLASDAAYGILPDAQGYLWISTNKGLSRFDPEKETFHNYYIEDGLQANEFNANAYARHTDEDLMVFGGINGLTVFSADQIRNSPRPAKVVLTEFRKMNVPDNSGVHISATDYIELEHSDYIFSVDFAATVYEMPERVRYAYRLDPFDKNWNDIGDRRNATFTNVPPGTYTLRVRAANGDGVLSEETSLQVYIRPAFWQTIWFQILVVLSLAGALYLGVRMRVKRIKRQKAVLESQVSLRTQQLRQKNDELQDTLRQLQEQKSQIEAQKHIIEEKSKDVLSSINYARRIQHAMLPSEKKLAALLPEYFVFYRPRDIISGDFYWITEKKGKVFLAAVDCTGHGVPGAFMSMIGSQLLGNIINEKGVLDPAQVLSEMHIRIKQSLQQDEVANRDGMDMSLCALDFKHQTIQFAAAKSHAVLIIGQTVQHLKGDKMPLGGFQQEDAQRYQNHQFDWTGQPMSLYLFSDGVQHQFGGPDNRKFGTRRFTELLEQHAQDPMQVQHKILADAVESWMSGYAQIDDMMVIGVRARHTPK